MIIAGAYSMSKNIFFFLSLLIFTIFSNANSETKISNKDGDIFYSEGDISVTENKTYKREVKNTLSPELAACKNGNECLEFGKQNYRAEKIKIAREFFIKGCNKYKNYPSCAFAGGIYKNSNNYSKAEDYLTRACKANNPDGCYFLGSLYLEDKDKSIVEKGFNALKKSCQYGSFRTCAITGNKLYQLFRFEEAFPLVEKACNIKKSNNHYLGDIEAISIAIGCNVLGNMYFYGNGVNRNRNMGINFVKMACNVKNKSLAELPCENLRLIGSYSK